MEMVSYIDWLDDGEDVDCDGDWPDTRRLY